MNQPEYLLKGESIWVHLGTLFESDPWVVPENERNIALVYEPINLNALVLGQLVGWLKKKGMNVALFDVRVAAGQGTEIVREVVQRGDNKDPTFVLPEDLGRRYDLVYSAISCGPEYLFLFRYRVS